MRDGLYLVINGEVFPVSESAKVGDKTIKEIVTTMRSHQAVFTMRSQKVEMEQMDQMAASQR